MLYVEDLDWDERNLDHIARHGITQYEVEEVCYNAELTTVRKDADPDG